MIRTPSSPIVIIAVSLAVLGSMALAAQDKYTLKVPNGLAFSEFRGYENWQDVAVSQTENGIKVIVANPALTGTVYPVTASVSPRVPRLRRSSGHQKGIRNLPIL